MGGNPWSRFFWSDWSNDMKLRACSLAAQGLWMRMLCIAAQHEPIGYVAVAGRALQLGDLARLCGVGPAEAETLLRELDERGVFSRDRHGRIYNRRMVRDALKSKVNVRNGKLGGNPNLCKIEENIESDKPPDKARLKPHSHSQNPVDIKNLVKDSVPRAPRASRANYADPAVRKQAWEAKISAELCREHAPDEAMRIIESYQRGEPEGKRIFETIDRRLKVATGAA